MPLPKADHTEGLFALKLALRLAAVDAIGGSPVRVLDAFAGHGTLWRRAKDFTDAELSVLSVDKQYGRGPRTVRGDNLRVMASLDLTGFDLIDFDAYGMPADQVAAAERGGYIGPIVWTAITINPGGLPMSMIEAEGIPREWAKIARVAVFCGGERDDSLDRWLDFMSRHGWDYHQLLEPPGEGHRKFYGVSGREGFVITEEAAMRHYNRVTTPEGDHREGHEDPLGQLDVEPDDRVFADHRGL